MLGITKFKGLADLGVGYLDGRVLRPVAAESEPSTTLPSTERLAIMQCV